MMNDDNTIMLSLAGEKYLFQLDLTNNQYKKSDLLNNGQSANGYGLLLDVGNTKELAAIYGFAGNLFFFYRKPYRIDDAELRVIQKDGFFKNRFQLFRSGLKEIDIKYKQIDVENDVFLDLVDWLNIQPRENLLLQLKEQAAFYARANASVVKD